MQNNQSLRELSTDLLIQFSKGDHQAFESIYWMYNAKVFNFVNSMLHDTFLSEDIVQSLFLKLWEKRETINPNLNFSSYLYTIAKNLVLKQIDEQFSHHIHLDSNYEDVSQQLNFIDPEIEAKSLNEYINQIVKQFPSIRQSVYLMSRREHLSNREIADTLSISERTVETHLYRALKEIKSKVEVQGIIISLLYLTLISQNS